MAKTPEQRIQELKDGVTWVVANVWDTETANVRKDLDASAYKNISALAKRYDAAQTKFSRGVDKKDKAKESFDKLSPELDKIEKQLEALYKTVDGLADEASATIKSKPGDSVEDVTAHWEELLKGSQGQTKECKACFDQISKLNESFDKLIADTLAKVRTQTDAAKTELSSANNELNGLEAQIRSAVIAAEGAAIKQNKPDVAKAVKAVLKVFGGK